MLHNEARNLQVKAYEKPHDAKAVTLTCGVYKLQFVEQIKKTRIAALW